MRRSGTPMNRNNNDRKPAWQGEGARQLREENDRKTDELARTVGLMKQGMIDLQGGIDKGNPLLYDIEGGMESSRGLLQDNMHHIGRVMESGTYSHMCYLIVFIVVVFLVLYFLMSR